MADLPNSAFGQGLNGNGSLKGGQMNGIDLIIMCRILIAFMRKTINRKSIGARRPQQNRREVSGNKKPKAKRVKVAGKGKGRKKGTGSKR